MQQQIQSEDGRNTACDAVEKLLNADNNPRLDPPDPFFIGIVFFH